MGFRITGIRKLEVALRQIQGMATDPDLWEGCAEIVVDEARKTLERGGPQTGKPWAPLADGSGRPPLQARSGAGEDSLHVTLRKDNTGALIRAKSYMSYHQTGVWQGRTKSGRLVGMGAVAKALKEHEAAHGKLSRAQRRGLMKGAMGLETGRIEPKRKWLEITKKQRQAILQLMGVAATSGWREAYAQADDNSPLGTPARYVRQKYGQL